MMSKGMCSMNVDNLASAVEHSTEHRRRVSCDNIHTDIHEIHGRCLGGEHIPVAHEEFTSVPEATNSKLLYRFLDFILKLVVEQASSEAVSELSLPAIQGAITLLISLTRAFNLELQASPF